MQDIPEFIDKFKFLMQCTVPPILCVIAKFVNLAFVKRIRLYVVPRSSIFHMHS